MDTSPDFNARKMTLEERERHVKQGLCFRCHQAGHLASQCGAKPPPRSRQVAALPASNTATPVASSATTPPTSAPAYTPSYTNANDAYAQMKAIYQSLPKEEQTLLIGSMEQAGF